LKKKILGEKVSSSSSGSGEEEESEEENEKLGPEKEVPLEKVLKEAEKKQVTADKTVPPVTPLKIVD